MISLIAAIDENNAIGYQGKMLCHLPADLKYFKRITSGHAVVMGRKTWESLPKKPLKNRHNIVVSRDKELKIDGAFVMNSIDEVLDYANDIPSEEIFVIGGAELYKQLMPYAKRLYITRIHHSFEKADTYFPDIDEYMWKKAKVLNFKAFDDNKYDYSFIEFTRK